MSETSWAVLTSWNLRPEVIFILGTMLTLYLVGWVKLRLLNQSRRKGAEIATTWRLISYLLGIICVVLALLSPIETLSGQFFFMHMIQHLLMMMFAPPLLLVANPFPMVIWGLPSRWRIDIGRLLFTKKSPVRRVLTQITKPGIGLVSYFIFLWGWHDPNMYNWTLQNGVVHDIEHVTFFLPAMLSWWGITGAAPYFHKKLNFTVRIALALISLPANMATGVIIAMSPYVIYTYYETVPFRLWNMSVLFDQTLGGAIMWVPGSMMYVLAIIILLATYSRSEDQKRRSKPRLPVKVIT